MLLGVRSQRASGSRAPNASGARCRSRRRKYSKSKPSSASIPHDRMDPLVTVGCYEQRLDSVLTAVHVDPVDRVSRCRSPCRSVQSKHALTGSRLVRPLWNVLTAEIARVALEGQSENEAPCPSLEIRPTTISELEYRFSRTRPRARSAPPASALSRVR
jgi:hypothetical protein